MNTLQCVWVSREARLMSCPLSREDTGDIPGEPPVPCVCQESRVGSPKVGWAGSPCTRAQPSL